MSSLARKIAKGRVKAVPRKYLEKLVAAAIVRNGEVVERGFRSHWQLRAALGDANPQARDLRDTEGFVTNNGRFVDREEAQDVALAAGQIKAKMRRELLSSDIDW